MDTLSELVSAVDKARQEASQASMYSAEEYGAAAVSCRVLYI